jgi:hypothetical protein
VLVLGGIIDNSVPHSAFACFCVTPCEIVSVTDHVIPLQDKRARFRMFVFSLTKSALCLSAADILPLAHAPFCTFITQIHRCTAHNLSLSLFVSLSLSLSETQVRVPLSDLCTSTFCARRHQDQPSLPKERTFFHAPKKLPLNLSF